jgi:chromosome segregation ATPase
MQLEGQNLQRDAEAWDKDNKIKELQKQLEIANNALDILRPAHITSSPEGSSKKRSYSLNGDEMYPDLLPSNVDVCDELASLRSVIKALESQNMKLSEKLADLQGASPKMNDQMVQTLESSMDIPPPPPLPVQNAAVQTMESSTDMDDVLSLKTRLSELIDQNDALTLQIDELKHEAATKKAEDDADRAHEKRKLHEEISSLTTKVQHLQEINDDLSLKVNESQAELVKAAERDGEKLGSLQKEVDNLKQQNRVLKHDLNEISSRSQYSAEANKDNMSSEKEEMLQEITSLRDHIQTLEEYNEELSSQLVELQEAVADITSRERDAVADEIQALQCQVEALETNNKQLSAKLEESRAETVNASQVEVEHRQEIASLRKALDEKNAHIHDDCKRELDNQKQHHQAELEALKSKLNQPQQEDMSGIHDACKRALEDHKEKHQAEVQNLKSQIYHLQDSNNANQEDISLLQIDLQNALNDCDENEIRHQQELSTVNMEFTNALNSLEYLQKENKRLKLDIQSLSDMSKMSHHGGEAPDSDAAYFEKEISAAHARFVSMEKSLQDRIERLEGEKYKLIMAHKDEIEKKDIAFEKVRVELSAWKLEMQNALNDIEGIKRERNELEQQIAVYKASLDALSSAGEDGQLDDFVGGN